MPIATRTLEVQPTLAGTIFASFVAVDDLGREWRRSRARFVDEATAQAALDAHDWSVQLLDADFADLLIWTQAKNAPGDFAFANRDITLLEGEERLLVWFASHEGEAAITVAWWIEDMNPPTYNAIRNRVGYDNDTGSRIQDRAVALFAVEPSFDVVEETP